LTTPGSRGNSARRYRYPWKLVVWAISIVPSNRVRVFLYRSLCGYRIERGARIGFGTIIAVDSATIGRAGIGRFDRFQGPFALEIGDGVLIGDRNVFDCGEWIMEERPEAGGRLCRIGANALVTGLHYFDVTAGFSVGEGSWIAGRGTQVWTHGADVPDGGVRIGSDCYVGSAVRFAPGSAVGDECVVGLGAVVTRNFEGNRLLLGGVPATVVRENVQWRKNQ